MSVFCPPKFTEETKARVRAAGIPVSPKVNESLRRVGGDVYQRTSIEGICTSTQFSSLDPDKLNSGIEVIPQEKVLIAITPLTLYRLKETVLARQQLDSRLPVGDLTEIFSHTIHHGVRSMNVPNN